jgi:phosphohistidine phosphatase SixA
MLSLGPNGTTRKDPMANPNFPARILIIRHGEKPDNKSDRHLSKQGRVRAEILAEKLPSMYPRISALFAAAPSKDSTRPYETIEPLAEVLGLTIDKSFADNQHSELARKILSDSADYGGETILICWHHEKIPALAREDLGQVAAPKIWPDEVFDQIWQINYSPDGRSEFAIRSQPPMPTT